MSGASGFATLVRNAARGDVFHVIDVETTGSAPPRSRVIELACVSLRAGRVVDRFETLIDPGVPVPPFITRLTGIKTAMLVGAPRPTEAMARFAAYVDALPGHFVAHNAGFDYGFLRHEFEAARLDWPFKGRYCTVRLARHALPTLARHNLDSLITHFGLHVADRHRAMADVEATATAFWRMVAMLDPALAVAEAIVPAPAPVPRPAAPPAGAVVPPGALPAGAWRAVLHAVKGESTTLAAMLEQHGALVGPAGDGAVLIALREPFLARVDARKRALLDGAVATVFGAGAQARLAAPEEAPA